ncbi:DNA replication factor Cdt1 [Neocloeon triangulifer]|uniref:DNA replication factor Cdt1 n=1 Tax=Neocloeon triangulifer TaxID=2078957 RepID=UPI00286ED479|nr:DNA replication factor Cdt1 [Neocloeon triangulifer]XP_059469170.1 DNA replication factor Cdt1 [Neocloeon triangulifer]
MSSQASITNFFGSRKRAATNSTPSRSKLLILEAQGAAKKKLKTIAVDVTPKQADTVLEKVKEAPRKATEKPEKAKASRSLNFDELKKRIRENAPAREKLKASLDKFQKLDAKLQIKPFEEPLEFDVPESPIKKPIYASPLKSPAKSPVKSILPQSPIKARVSLKFESEKEGLILPQSYQALHSSFKAMDVAACMLENRKETVTLSKVSTAVEQISRRNFGREKLGQIKTVDPACVDCKLVKDDLELNMNFIKDAQGKSWSCLPEREKSFRAKLIEIVKTYHQEFLMQLRPPLEIAPEKVVRWHPEFEPNLVPEIKPSPLPEANKNKIYTASEVLEANSWLKSNTRVAQALAKLQDEKKDEKPEDAKAEEPPLNPCFKGLPASLLAKVRQKQAEKARIASLAIMRPSHQEKEVRRMERLPVLAKYMRNIFVSEKKSVLRMDLLIQRLSNCFPHPLPNDEFQQHIDLILKGAPHWVEKISLRRDVYVRVVKDVEFEQLQSTLEKMQTHNN